MNKEQLNSGDLFYLATCGKPQIIRVGRPGNKGNRNQIQQIPFETFKQLRTNLDLSNKGTRKLISTLNKATGKRVVQSELTKLLSDLELTVINYYSVQFMQFEVGDKKVDRNLVFVKDSSDFVMNIIGERVMNPYNTIVRV